MGSGCGCHQGGVTSPISRYRKIPGDKCSGGESPSREEKDMKKKCTSNFLNPSQLVGDGDTGQEVTVTLAGCGDGSGRRAISCP